MTYTSSSPTKQAAIRGALQRCPACGRGHLFGAYLKQVDRCADCGEDFAHIRADDGPAWLTVMVVGHIVVALMLMANAVLFMPLWISLTGFISLAGVLVLGLLQRAKGIFIGMIWSMNAAEAISAPAAVLPAD
jgi:uncharacterized protein (DUF983 family)